MNCSDVGPVRPERPRPLGLSPQWKPFVNLICRVSRLWPRGISKERADLAEWCKAVSPSNELRQWYEHDPEKFDEFVRRYQAELEQPEQAEAFAHLQHLANTGPLTLLTATKTVEISHARVLRDLLMGTSPTTA